MIDGAPSRASDNSADNNNENENGRMDRIATFSTKLPRTGRGVDRIATFSTKRALIKVQNGKADSFTWYFSIRCPERHAKPVEKVEILSSGLPRRAQSVKKVAIPSNETLAEQADSPRRHPGEVPRVSACARARPGTYQRAHTGQGQFRILFWIQCYDQRSARNAKRAAATAR